MHLGMDQAQAAAAQRQGARRASGAPAAGGGQRDRGGSSSACGRVILLNKPYGALCQFTADASGKPTLADFVQVPGCLSGGTAGCGQRRAGGADRRRSVAGAHHEPLEQARENVLGTGRRHGCFSAARGACRRRRTLRRRHRACRSQSDPGTRRPLAPPTRDPVAQGDPDILAGNHPYRRPQSAGAADDGRRGPAYAASHSPRRRSVDDRWHRPGHVARGLRETTRAMIGAGPLHCFRCALRRRPPQPSVSSSAPVGRATLMPR